MSNPRYTRAILEAGNVRVELFAAGRRALNTAYAIATEIGANVPESNYAAQATAIRDSIASLLASCESVK